MDRKENSRAIRLNYQGRSQTIAEWCKELNLPIGIIRQRIHVGWSAAEALEGPLVGRQQIKIPRYVKDHGR